MASSSDAKGFKQDMVVSIRYRNDLPPPPMPPKFLDIDTGGLAQYLTTGYASGLAKREEPNIEVDAEGGMPIDMVGVPGYFLGDESAIMAPEIQPVLDPADHALMLSIDQLKSQGAKNNVSFLRKTQYMTAAQMARANDPLLRTNARVRKTSESKAAGAPIARDDKENIKRHIQKGFDLAYPDSIAYNPPEAQANPITPQEREAWRNPVHPDNPRLKPVEFYPIIPDLEAVTDMQGNWQALKFEKPPLPPYRGRRDDRIDVALLMAAQNTAELSKYQAKKKAFEEHPDLYEDPGAEPYSWSLNIPKQPDSASRYRKILNDANPNKDDPALYAPLLEESADGSQRLPYERVRVFPSATQNPVDPHRVMAISLASGDKLSSHSRLRKQGSAAYYYPILDRVRVKADRNAVEKPRSQTVPEDGFGADLPDQLMIMFAEPEPSTIMLRNQFRGEYDAAFAGEWSEIVRNAEAAAEEERANEIVDEQGTLHEGAQDVSMAEVEGAEDAEVAMNGVAHKDRDDDRNTPPPPANGADADAEEDEDMRDD
ncbi:hypothetical protein LTR10_017406 [Elasticomyces elasticus]|uniref:Paf1 complex protein n=1 Tax=Exophiala sideris TaxID=1016849 RepID=A0ABR0J920_9EURO|nr:hypothetical protein LTR10_017406 [Elasticomyces elasticus]KAK5027838.1 hypothetical protein LTS07_006713 [Exophiala sideris]KAK5037573.1 hypothetical protein LTR13_004731 [Exophiala sideris]KAK5059234.1 hypothetical protein LTR69_006524 [Exophiala sideris]KAK5183068.1 hypothetical protein LTR44_004779 [Eurotiomycetes sp. CCFEE 6388]